MVIYPVLTHPDLEPEWAKVAGQEARKILDSLHIEYIDLTADPELVRYPEKYREVANDIIHPSAEGHRAAGKRIMERISTWL